MGFQDQAIYATPSTDPGVYKYTHLGTAAGTNQIGPAQPTLIGYVQINSLALGTVVAYDSTGTSSAVIGSCAITSVPGSAPVAPLLFRKLATKTAFCITNTAGLDLTVASLP